MRKWESGKSAFLRKNFEQKTRRYKSFVFSPLVLTLVITTHLLALPLEDLGEPWSTVARLIDSRQYTSAVSKLEENALSSTDPVYLAELYYRIGSIHHHYTHDYDKALASYQKVVGLSNQVESLSELEPFLAISWMSIGGIYRRTSRYEDAIETYAKVTADYPGTGYADYATRNIKGIRNAQAEIKQRQGIIEKYPGTEFAAEAQFDIAELYLSVETLDNPRRAIEEYNKLIAQYPGSRRTAEAQLRIGNIYRTDLNSPGEAIVAYQKLVQGQFPESKLQAEAIFQTGRIYYNGLRDYNKALGAFNSFIKDYPSYWKFPAAVYWQGMCYEQLEDYDNAVKAFELFVQLYPDTEPGWLADIGKLGELKVKAETESRIENLKKLAPEVKQRMAERLRTAGKYREALAIYRELMSEYPDSIYSREAIVQSNSLKSLAELQIQQDIIRKGGAAASAAQYRIAEMYEIEIQDYQQAAVAYEKVIANYPDSYWAADALYQLGIIYSGSEALETYTQQSSRKASNIKPDYAKALDKYSQLVQKYPRTFIAAKAYYQMGETYRVHRRDYNLALEAYAKVIRDYPTQEFYVGDGYKDSLADEAQFKIGRIYFENLKNYDVAMETFKKFLNDYPDSCRRAAAYSFIAAIQEKQNDRKAAADSYEQIMDIIFSSDIQNTFFIRDAIYESDRGETRLQRDIIRQLRQRVSKLQE